VGVDGKRGIASLISGSLQTHVKGVLEGSDVHLDILKTALESDEWKIGTAEALFHNDTPELHVNVTTQYTLLEAEGTSRDRKYTLITNGTSLSTT